MWKIDPATPAEQIIELILALILTFYSLLVTFSLVTISFASSYCLLIFNVDVDDDHQM